MGPAGTQSIYISGGGWYSEISIEDIKTVTYVAVSSGRLGIESGDITIKVPTVEIELDNTCLFFYKG